MLQKTEREGEGVGGSEEGNIYKSMHLSACLVSVLQDTLRDRAVRERQRDGERGRDIVREREEEK